MSQLNRSTLDQILAARNLDVSSLAARLSMDPSSFTELLRDEPSSGLVREIAKELSVPAFVLYMNGEVPVQRALPDFRSTTPAPSAKSAATNRIIDMAFRVQELAREAGHRCRQLPVLSLQQLHQAEQAAGVRASFQITIKEQLESQDARAFYALCRKKIESYGIFVLHDSFPVEDGSGFVLADTRVPIIVVNTRRQNHGRRLFTLVHEIAHVLVGKSGITDPFKLLNDTERACNKFAALFLAPAEMVRNVLEKFGLFGGDIGSYIRRIAQQLKISQQAAMIRLVELKVVAWDTYEEWLTAVERLGNPDEQSAGGGGRGRVAEEKMKLARFGFTFASVFRRAISEGLLTPLALYRATGLKPKYQSSYFVFASSAGVEDVED